MVLVIREEKEYGLPHKRLILVFLKKHKTRAPKINVKLI